MPKKITIEVQESIKDLDKILKRAKSTLIRKRIEVLKLVKIKRFGTI